MPRRLTISDRAVEALMEASRVFTGVVAHSLAEVNSTVSVPGLRVLVMLSARESANISTVAEALGVNASNASRTCDRLVDAGLVERRTLATDRRQIEVLLTKDGSDFVQRLMEQRRQLIRGVVDELPVRQRRALTEAMESFAEAARRSSSVGTLSDDEGHLVRWLG
jgi:DNA-binding MarR family transcriptional regulator